MRAQLDRAHFVAWQAPTDPPVHPREARAASLRRLMWRCSPLHFRQRFFVACPWGEGDGCKDLTSTILRTAEVMPPVSLLLINRLRLVFAWLAFAVGLLLKGKMPIGPGSHTYALPSRGLSGPWQRPSPLAFGGSPGHYVACIAPTAKPAPHLRPLLRRAAECAPKPTHRERVTISAGGWVMRPRYEPELYGPALADMPRGTA